MDELYKHLSNIYAMDRATLAIICVLCLMSAAIIKEYMANAAFIVFVYPLLAVLSVLIHYAILQAELFPPRKLDQWMMWTIFSTVCGNVAGIIVVALIGRVRESLRKPFERAPSVQRRI